MALHTDTRFEEGLQQLKAAILTMAGAVEVMIGGAMQSIVGRDAQAAAGVIQQDAEVNRLEMQVDEHCLSLLALHQPAASDLRFIAMGLRISKDLERMGDLAVNVAERALQLQNEPPLKPYLDLPRMGAQVRTMVRQGLDAFVRRDAALAEQVCQMDDTVDEFLGAICDELVRIMQQQPAVVLQGTWLIAVARNLERIADHATNIAEEVVYMVAGRDIRHGGKTWKHTKNHG